jgi:hypothetical protein
MFLLYLLLLLGVYSYIFLMSKEQRFILFCFYIFQIVDKVNGVPDTVGVWQLHCFF